MDRVRTAMLAPLLVEEMRAEARRETLADLATRSRQPPRLRKMAILLGGLLIAAGCRIDAAGRRHVPGGAPGIWPAPCAHEP